ncbi:type IV pilus modification PilV family protein [Microcystis aeruginosa]|uniref:Type 4 pilin-like protein n=1 Tax=Microcystis aeruginosa PCC 9443 TaxID=1160281 RepID=I4G3D9_MICAE|nr:hypothetical protein [Microcystis aeruginosa]CCI02450.1 Type 4 pilin-like protein [Microcystis aeruginosa PCC 9443]
MLEVIIAILIITAFLTGTLQLMAVNALYKVRAKRQAQANFWIQEDFEDTKYKASTLAFDKKKCTGKEGYATALKGKLTATPIDDRTIVGKKYSLARTFPDDDTAQSAHPHRLRIDYQVQLATGQIADDYQNQEKVIARSSVEVIPDASFNCP